MTVTTTIRAILESRGWTIHQLADHLGTSPHTAQGWLYGRKPSRLALSAIAALAIATNDPSDE